MKIFLTAVFAIASFLLYAQITVTNNYFPEAGDTLRLRSASNVAFSAVTQSGAGQVWDFSGLSIGSINTVELYLPVSAGGVADSFPTANLFQKLEGTAGTYIRVTQDHFENLGAQGADGSNFGIDLITKFDQAYISRRAPLSLSSSNLFTTAKSTIRISINDLPPVIRDTLLGALPIPIDSMGFGAQQSRKDEIIAAGTLSIPGGDFQVIQEKRVEVRSLALEIKVPIFGWQDFTDFLIQAGGFPGFGKDTTTAHYFWSDESKEPIAIVTTDNADSRVVATDVKDMGIRTSASGLQTHVPEFIVSPNPARDVLSFQYRHLPKGNYILKIFENNGRLAGQFEILISGQEGQYQIPANSMVKGLKIFSLRTDDGRLIRKGKIVLH